MNNKQNLPWCFGFGLVLSALLLCMVSIFSRFLTSGILVTFFISFKVKVILILLGSNNPLQKSYNDMWYPSQLQQSGVMWYLSQLQQLGDDMCRNLPSSRQSGDNIWYFPSSNNQVMICGIFPVQDNQVMIYGIFPSSNNQVMIYGIFPSSNNQVMI